MWRFLAAVVVELLEWIGERMSESDTGQAAGRDDSLRDRIRQRVRRYENRVRRARRSDQDGP